MIENPTILTLFGTLEEMYKELMNNNDMEITDEKKLVIKIDANYKDKAFHHTIKLQIEELRFQSVIKQSEFLFDHLSEVNRYYDRQKKINLEKGMCMIYLEKQRERQKAKKDEK